MDLALVLLFCSSLVTADPVQLRPAAPDTLVICHPHLERAMMPWVRYRTAQGHRLSLVTEFDAEDFVDGLFE